MIKNNYWIVALTLCLIVPFSAHSSEKRRNLGKKKPHHSSQQKSVRTFEQGTRYFYGRHELPKGSRTKVAVATQFCKDRGMKSLFNFGTKVDRLDSGNTRVVLAPIRCTTNYAKSAERGKRKKMSRLEVRKLRAKNHTRSVYEKPIVLLSKPTEMTEPTEVKAPVQGQEVTGMQ